RRRHRAHESDVTTLMVAADQQRDPVARHSRPLRVRDIAGHLAWVFVDVAVDDEAAGSKSIDVMLWGELEIPRPRDDQLADLVFERQAGQPGVSAHARAPVVSCCSMRSRYAAISTVLPLRRASSAAKASR